jgi:hypothetical protein
MVTVATQGNLCCDLQVWRIRIEGLSGPEERMEQERIKAELDKLENSEEAKADLAKLNPMQMLEVGKITRNIYNEACYDCKRTLYNKQITKFSDLCDRCRRDFEMKRLFGELQTLYQGLKK